MRLRLLSSATAIVALLCASTTLAAQKVSPQERVNQIAEATSLVRAGTAPWHLRMTFQLYDLGGKPTQMGTIEEWWAAPGIFRRVITSPSYNKTVPAPGDQSAPPSREKFFVDLLVDQVIDPVPHFGDIKGVDFSVADQKFGKIDLTCYSVKMSSRPSGDSGHHFNPEFCVNDKQNALRVRFDAADFIAVRNNMGQFRGIEFGIDNSLGYGDKQAISGHIETLETYDPSKSSMEMTRSNPDPVMVPGIMVSGKILKKTQPSYPGIAKSEHLSGTVVLAAIITTQGTIGSLDVISSPHPAFSQAAIDAVKQWTYSPYLLNGQPAEVYTTITINFNFSASR